MTAEVCQHTGWTWPEVESQVCLHRHDALVRQWRRSPPLQVMVQGFMGIEPEEVPRNFSSPAAPADEDTAIQEFARQFAAAGGLVH